MTKAIFGLVCFLIAFGGAMAPANAQATRTWVSGVGDDANPCSRTAPCKTFAGAISKTAANGEIDCLDPGGFGSVTITKAITIDCNGVAGGILSSSTNGVIVNAGVNDRVILRNLSINGAGTGINGIRYLAGAQLSLYKVTIEGTTNNGVDVAKSVSGELHVVDSFITKVHNGIRVTTTGGTIVVAIQNTTIANVASHGFDAASNNILATISDSTIIGAGQSGVITSAGNATVNVVSSTVTNSAVAGINANALGSTIRISNNAIYNNVADLVINNSATLASNTTNTTGPASGASANASITMR